MRERVVDAGPLIFLARLEHLPLLHIGAGCVLVPSAVLEEVFRKPDQAAERIRDCLGKTLQVCADRREETLGLLRGLGPGEQEAIAQALDRSARSVVLDDLCARRTARRLGLHPIGTVGLILAAKKRGLIPSVRLELLRLRAMGFWISDALWRESVAAAGENDESG